MNKKTFAVACAFLLALGVLPVLAAQDAPARTIKLKVSAEQANLREKPDIGSAIVQQIPEGTVLEADKKEGEWYLVRYVLEDGGVIAGWIHESLVIVLDESRVPAAKQETGRRPSPGSQPPARREGPPAAAASRPESRFPIDIFLAAGGSTIVADDFNRGARGLADLNAAALGIPPVGTVNRLHLTYIFGIEVFYRVNPWFSVGLGTDLMSGWRSSRVTYPTGDLALFAPHTSTRPSVQAFPFKAGLRFYPRPDFYIRGSFAYYSAQVRYEYMFAPSEDTWQEWKGRATAHTLGMEVAVGGEWRLGPRLFFFSEAGFRLAQLERFKGTGTFRDSTGASSSEAGYLWYYQARGADGGSYNLLFIRSAEPSGTDILGARRARLNLAGAVFRAGVTFRF
jgi:hypothetical protein